jgi:hypothetical protein
MVAMTFKNDKEALYWLMQKAREHRMTFVFTAREEDYFAVKKMIGEWGIPFVENDAKTGLIVAKTDKPPYKNVKTFTDFEGYSHYGTIYEGDEDISPVILDRYENSNRLRFLTEIVINIEFLWNDHVTSLVTRNRLGPTGIGSVMLAYTLEAHMFSPDISIPMEAALRHGQDMEEMYS